LMRVPSLKEGVEEKNYFKGNKFILKSSC
jgi:hypothetical protein